RIQEDDSAPEDAAGAIGARTDLERDAGAGQRAIEGSENETKSQDAKRQGGIGNMPPVPDSDQLAPLTSFDTSAYLKKAAERILSEHRAHYAKSTSRPSQNLKDW